jgi:uncharacterized protein
VSRRSVRARVQDAGLPESYGVGGDLPDINVWLALSIKEHPHHAAATAYWSDLSLARIWFCRVTMLGLVRLLTQRAVAQQAAMTLQQAMAFYSELLALANIAGVAAEPLEIEGVLNQFVHPNLPAKHLTDAYLAAFAVCSDLRLVTFDRDFERFEGLRLLRLST